MKLIFQKCTVTCFLVLLCKAILSVSTVQAQTCPPPITTTITSYSNTYYPGQQATVSAGFFTIGPYGGSPGAPFAQRSPFRLVMGGGGGAGDNNDGTGSPFDGLASSGAAGGGIGNLTITLFNVAGHAALRRLYRLKTEANELRLTNLETLPAGIYFVQASDGVSNRNGKLIIHHSF